MSRTLIAIAFVLLCGLSAGLRAAEKSDAPALTEQQRVELTKLKQNFAAARGDAAKQTQVVDRAIELGPLGVERIKSIVQLEMQRNFEDYSRAFGAQAVKVKDADTATIVASSERLQSLRGQLVGIAELVSRLEAAAGGESFDAQAKLSELEESYLRRNRLGPIYSQLDDAEILAIEETNKRRAENNLPPLEIDLKLTLAARDHSKDMAEHGFFAHESPIEGKASFVDRAKRFDGEANGENIYMGNRSGAVAVQAWMDSPGHRENILRPSFRRIGIGRYDKHWTQVFGN